MTEYHVYLIAAEHALTEYSMTKNRSFFRIICPVVLLCIFLSKIAFGSTQYFQKSSHQKSQHQSVSFTDPADADEELSTEKMEFKDFMIDSSDALRYFYISKKAPKNTLYFALPLTHLPIPIEPPR